MPYIVWRLKVEDYAKWKSVFDEDPLDRGANGSKGGYLFRNANDPNEVTLILEWDEAKMEQLRQLNESPRMKEVQERSGYTAPPEVNILELVEKPSI